MVDHKKRSLGVLKETENKTTYLNFVLFQIQMDSVSLATLCYLVVSSAFGIFPKVNISASHFTRSLVPRFSRNLLIK